MAYNASYVVSRAGNTFSQLKRSCHYLCFYVSNHKFNLFPSIHVQNYSSVSTERVGASVERVCIHLKTSGLPDREPVFTGTASNMLEMQIRARKMHRKASFLSISSELMKQFRQWCKLKCNSDAAIEWRYKESWRSCLSRVRDQWNQVLLLLLLQFPHAKQTSFSVEVSSWNW